MTPFPLTLPSPTFNIPFPNEHVGNKMKKTTAKVSLPLYLWTGIMLALNSVPGDAIPELASSWQLDKVAHLIEYLLFSALLFRFVRYRWPFTHIRALVVTISVATAFALLDEIHQIPIPNRQCTWQDLLADLAGVGLGILAIQIVLRHQSLPDRMQMGSL
jgi:VanZ family protein